MATLIEKIAIYKYSIPMHPFTIATGTMDYAQNILLKVHTTNGLVGYGECSAFPMIVGETQNTCYEMAKDFAKIWLGKEALAIEDRMNELHLCTAYNSTIKSAFDMALYDIAAQNAQQPLCNFLTTQLEGATPLAFGKELGLPAVQAVVRPSKKQMLTDITVGINTPEVMAAQAKNFVDKGATILKVKLGKDVVTDVARIKAIRETVGQTITIRIDANQGWSYTDAIEALTQLGKYSIEFCEQPMRIHNDKYLPELLKSSPIKIMADESVYNHYDALRLIENNSCHSINIKLAKSGGIQEAKKIIDVCTQYNIPCMMGGMLESRVALTAFAHFAAANNQIIYYDMDTCMLGHKVDPVIGGVTFNGYAVELPINSIGIGASVDEGFLQHCDCIIIK